MAPISYVTDHDYSDHRKTAARIRFVRYCFHHPTTSKRPLSIATGTDNVYGSFLVYHSVGEILCFAALLWCMGMPH